MKKAISIVLVLVLCMVAEIAKASFVFGTPTEVPNINSPSNELHTSISSDALSLYFTSNRSGGIGALDIWLTTRETTDDPWGTPHNLGPTVNSSANDGGVSISSNGLSLYFSSTRFRGGNADLWVTRRDTIHNEWGTPINLGPTVNSSADQCYTSISSDELELYFSSNRSGGAGGYDIWVTKRETIHDPWGTPENLGPTVNSSSAEAQTGISADGRMLFFVSDRSGGYGQLDIWVASRATTDAPWGEPVNLGAPVNSSGFEEYPSVSADGSTLFFRYGQSSRWSGGDIWQAPIIPIVDLNSDGIVDSADMCMMVDHWGTDNSLCDIGPMPWGDGIVDVEDLKVLVEHLFEEVSDPTLIAHWPLDETEGMAVMDNAGNNDGYALGDPLWMPEGGQVNGALQLDGVDDYVVTGTAPNPEEGSFSVLAWIKDGAPGQVVLSQMGKANWLCADHLGTLMTELTVAGRDSCSLGSEAIITDGNWHRIGFVWDGAYRRLYVDGVLVAEDAQDHLDISVNGLYFGTGKLMESGTFFSGLIDDIRIYNRVVSP